VNVLSIVSPRLLYEQWQEGRKELLGRAGTIQGGILDELILPAERQAPIVTVQDGASHSLAWLGSVFGVCSTCLGVDTFGQTGTRADLYRHFGMDAAGIAEAAFSALEMSES